MPRFGDSRSSIFLVGAIAIPRPLDPAVDAIEGMFTSLMCAPPGFGIASLFRDSRRQKARTSCTQFLCFTTHCQTEWKRAIFLQQEGFLLFQTLIFLMNTDVRSSNQGFARKSQPIVKPYPMYDELYNLPLRDSCQGYEVLLMPSDAHWCCLRRCVGCKERTLINYQDIWYT